VYTYQLQGVDTVTGKDRTVNVFVKTEAGKQYVRLMRGGKAPPPNWFPSSANEVFFASDSRIGLMVASDLEGKDFSGEMVASIDGPAIAGAQAFDTVRTVCPSVIPAYYGKPGRPGHADAHKFDVMEGAKTYSLPVPSKLNSILGIFNGVDGRSGKAYVSARFQRPGAPWLDRLWEISYRARPPILTPLPDQDPTTVWWKGARGNGLARLADNTICMLLQPDPGDHQKGVSGKFATAILDLKTRRWKLWDKLIFFGSSLNGRYVAYGWGAEPVIRIARIGP
ncbi:MAG: hypothetical protein ACHQ50_11800, partial [Fimbriimonadales bacterium]